MPRRAQRSPCVCGDRPVLRGLGIPRVGRRSFAASRVPVPSRAKLPSLLSTLLLPAEEEGELVDVVVGQGFGVFGVFHAGGFQNGLEGFGEAPGDAQLRAV